MPSFDNMRSAGGELPVSEKIKSVEEPASAEPPAVPNLSILDGLTSQPQATAGEVIPEPKELGPLAVPAESPPDTNSLFTRLTGELSKESVATKLPRPGPLARPHQAPIFPPFPPKSTNRLPQP